MQRPLTTLSAIAVGLALAGPAAAQESAPQEEPAAAGAAAPSPDAATTTPAATPAEEEATPQEEPEAPDAITEAEPAPDAAGEPSAGQAPAAPAPLAGQPQEDATVRDTFGDWSVRCQSGTEECVLHQIGRDEQENPVIEFSLLRVPEGNEAAALVNVLTPLGTFLPAGLSMQVDQGQTRQYGFTFCTGIGCIAQIALTEETAAAMRRGRTATLRLASITAPDEPVEVDLSLIGFTDAWNSVTPVAAPAVPAPAPAAPSPAPAAPILPPAQ